MKKAWLLIFSIGLFSLFFLMVKDDPGIKSPLVQKGGSSIEGLRMLHRRDGVQHWTMSARRADMTASGDEAHLSDVTVSFADKGITVQTARGTYLMRDRRLTADGTVIARGPNFSVISEGVAFDSASGSLQTSGPVVIEGRKFRVKGTGMQAAESGQTVKILHDVTAVFNN